MILVITCFVAPVTSLKVKMASNVPASVGVQRFVCAMTIHIVPFAKFGRLAAVDPISSPTAVVPSEIIGSC
jgi:hypothetical protein